MGTLGTIIKYRLFPRVRRPMPPNIRAGGITAYENLLLAPSFPSLCASTVAFHSKAFPLSAILPQLPLPVIPADIPNGPGRGRKALKYTAALMRRKGVMQI